MTRELSWRQITKGMTNPAEVPSRQESQRALTTGKNGSAEACFVPALRFISKR
jgi:hypothetical protein